jgi:hypothetical protein
MSDGASVPDQALVNGAASVSALSGFDPSRLLALAAGLPAAQRDAVFGKKVRGSAKPKLLEAGLMRLDPLPCAAWARTQRYEYVLTELGKTVRDAIATEAGTAATA